MPRKSRQRHTWRYRALFAVFAGLLLLVAGRLTYLQVVAGPAYAQMAFEQRNREIDVPPRRGSIYDREGEPLAVSMEARDIYAVPSAIKDPEGAAKAIAGVLGGTADGYLAKLKKDSPFVYLERKADIERAEALENLALEGIGFQESSRARFSASSESTTRAWTVSRSTMTTSLRARRAN
jgi:cell division protein FtsI (penicillin-binding protein 3)